MARTVIVPDAVERIILSLIGVDDVEFGKRLRAFVVAIPEGCRDADEMKSYVRSRLTRRKVPRDVVFVDGLPRHETGRLLRNMLSENIK